MERSSVLLSRYTEQEKDVILEYFRVLAGTRKTGRVAPSVLEKELKYWEGFPPGVVVRALMIHLQRYPQKREAYTRGIMRSLRQEEEAVKKKGQGRQGYGQGRYKEHYAGVKDGKLPF